MLIAFLFSCSSCDLDFCGPDVWYAHGWDLRDDEIDLLAKLGYDGIELACWGDHVDVTRAAKSKKYAKSRKEMLAALVDDSLVRVVAGRELVLRRSRGYSPAPIEMDVELSPVLALGGEAALHAGDHGSSWLGCRAGAGASTW